MNMLQNKFFERAQARIRTMPGDKRGNVAVIFALTMFPIFILMGFAIDLQQVNTSKNRIQYIVDSAVIGGAREMQDGKTDKQIKSYLVNYFKAAVKETSNGVVCTDPLATVTAKSQDISMDVQCYQKTAIMNLIGQKKLDFKVSSASTYGIGNVDIAFVFDISGSMGSNGKMDALKAAAEDAIDVLLPKASTTSVKKGEVRIGMASYSSMVDAGDYFKAVTGENKIRTYTDFVETETTTYDKVCFKYRKNGKCKKWKNVPTTTTETVPVTKTITNTCVKERVGKYAQSDIEPGPSAWIEAAEATFTQTKNGGYWSEETCSKMPPLPLTDDRNDLLDYIDDLYPSGGTAGHLGVAWGWYLIAEDWNSVWPSASKPWKYNDPDTAKAMILMTDGEFNRVYDDEDGDSFEQAKLLCDEIKTRNINIYTVAFNAPTKGQEILSYCASGEEFAFKPDNAAELTEAYTSIAKAISDLRIKY